MESVLNNVMKSQLDKFDEWLRNNLDRSFPDHVILSVFQFHFISSFVDSGVSFENMCKLMKDQYEVIERSKKQNIEEPLKIEENLEKVKTRSKKQKIKA